MPLTDTAIKQAQPKLKPYRLADAEGLYLEVAPSGGKWWRMKYRFAGKEKRLSLGVYPKTGLKEARRKLQAAKDLLVQGTDPGVERKSKKLAGLQRHANSFEVVAREWLEKFQIKWTDGHTRRLRTSLEQDIFPAIGKRAIADITPPELLHALRRVEARGAIYTAHRLRQACGQIFRYAIATQRTQHNPADVLKGALTPIATKHHATLTDPKKVGELLRALDGYSGTFVVRCALLLAPLVFVRPGEIRKAEWIDFNLDAALWRIPADKMKMEEQHIVALAPQAIAILRRLHPLTGDGRYLFPSIRTRSRPMSENTLNAALRRLGYTKDDMTAQGFRSMASTLLNELGWNRDAIERQLAHGERNGVRAAYNFAEYLPERFKMMAAWANYLDSLKGGPNVVAMARSA